MNLGAIVLVRSLLLPATGVLDDESSRLGWIPIFRPPLGMSSFLSLLAPPPPPKVVATGRAELGVVAGAAAGLPRAASRALAAAIRSWMSIGRVLLAAGAAGLGGAEGREPAAGGGEGAA